MRHRHALYLSEAMSQKLQTSAETHRVSKSAILERALQQCLEAPNSSQQNDMQNLQHEATLRLLRRLERDLAIAAELTATFVRYYLTISPPLPESEHQAARALGQLRFEQVIEDIGRRLRTDRSLMARVMAAMTSAPNEAASDNTGPEDDDATPPFESVPSNPKPDLADGRPVRFRETTGVAGTQSDRRRTVERPKDHGQDRPRPLDTLQIRQRRSLSPAASPRAGTRRMARLRGPRLDGDATNGSLTGTNGCRWSRSVASRGAVGASQPAAQRAE
jgi:predicted transcriptional regulator